MAAIVIRFPDGTEQEQELAEQLTVGRADGNDQTHTRDDHCSCDSHCHSASLSVS